MNIDLKWPIGDGSPGSVVKIKHITSDEEFAAKVVHKKYAADGEVSLWKTLNRKNIPKLIDIHYAYYADSYIFITPLYPTILEQKLTASSFISDKNALKQTINWLKEILNAIAYIYDKGLSHDDVTIF